MKKVNTKKVNPILIVGAGPTGLVMAALCYQYRLPFRLINKSPTPSAYSKALVMQARTQEVIAQMGLIDKMIAAGKAIENVTFDMDREVRIHLALGEAESPYKHSLIIGQSDTERILIEDLKKHKIKVEREYELVDLQQKSSYVTATIKKPDGKKEKGNYSWVIGCDGAHSTVRQLLNLKFSGATYEERFFLADLKVDWSNPSSHEVLAYVTQGRIGALIPLKDGHYRFIGILPPDFVPEHVPQDTSVDQKTPTLNDLQKICRQVIPIPAKLHSPKWIATFRSHRRIAEKFRVRRVFLAGDAAHIHSPAGGQGMNTGIQDVHNLAWKLWLVTRKNAPDALLDTYHQERYPLARSILHYTDLAFKSVTLKNRLFKKIRNFIVPLLLKKKRIQTLLRNAMLELSIIYDHTKLNVYGNEKGLGKKIKMGQRAPNITVTNNHGQQSSLLSLFDYKYHTLLVFLPRYVTKRKELKKLLTYRWAKVIIINPLINGNRPIEKATYLESNPEQIAKVYGVNNSPTLFLIRPDGYIAGRSLMDNGSYLKMLAHYEKLI